LRRLKIVMKKINFCISVITLVLSLGVGVANANIILGTFDFNSSQFGNALVESDGGTFSKSNWLNIVNVDPGNTGYLTGANFNTGVANIGLGGNPLYTIYYNTPIVNQSGYDFGIVTARYSTNDTATLEVSSNGGSIFSSSLNFGPSVAVATGIPYNYYYGGNGPYSADLFVTPVDLTNFGIASGATINAIRITGAPELDLIRVAGLNSVVPIPAAIWLLGSGLIGLAGFRKKLKG
jgi:hypothetical protein